MTGKELNDKCREEAAKIPPPTEDELREIFTVQKGWFVEQFAKRNHSDSYVDEFGTLHLIP